MNTKIFQKIQVIREQAVVDSANVIAKADRDIERVKQRAQAAEDAANQRESLRRCLEDKYGMEKHPKREVLWSMAWKHGHAYGESEVSHWYGELSELVL